MYTHIILYTHFRMKVQTTKLETFEVYHILPTVTYSELFDDTIKHALLLNHRDEKIFYLPFFREYNYYNLLSNWTVNHLDIFMYI